MNKIKFLLIALTIFFIENVRSQVNSSYLFISYFQSEEYFPNNVFFIPIPDRPKDDSELLSILNDTLNRIYYDIDYFILNEEDNNIDRIEKFIDLIQKDSSSIIYSSKKCNLKIYLFKTSQNLEKYYWNQNTFSSIPLFFKNKKRTYTKVEGRYVLKSIPSF